METNVDDELSAMRALVENFKWTTLTDFRDFVNHMDIRALRVQGQHPEWDRRFRDAWGALDEVYALMSDRHESSPNQFFQQLIASSVDKLKVLLS